MRLKAFLRRGRYIAPSAKTGNAPMRLTEFEA